MTERVDLNTFQQQLARRLADAGSQARSAHWLAVAEGGHRLLLPLTHAGEVFPAAPVQPLPWVKPWVRGVSTWRSGLYTVVDLLEHLGLPREGAAQAPRHFVSFNPALGVSAVWPVAQMLGLKGAHEFSPDPAARLPVDTPVLRQSLQDADGQVWLELDLRPLVASPDFLDLHLRGAATAS